MDLTRRVGINYEKRKSLLSGLAFFLLRRLYTGQAGLWPGTSGSGGTGRQTAGTGGKSQETDTALC